MKNKIVLSLLLASMLGTGITPVMAEEANGAAPDAQAIVELFQNPDTASKGMFRYWLPDGGESYERLETEMTDMYNSGFGGVEIAFFPGTTKFDNSTYGWATENWRTVMKNILKIAASFETPFVVDFTITPGWPVAFNSIDPNDEAADKELVTSYTKITSADAVMEIPMADIVTGDAVENPFIIRNDLIAAVIGRVKSADENGVPVLDVESLQTVETSTTGKTTVAGIPSVEGLDKESEEYKYIVGLYEGQEPDTSIYFKDSAGNPIDVRTARKDTQEYYQTDLAAVDFGEYTPSEGEGLAEGDYVLYGFYQKGTGATTLSMGNYAPFEAPQPGVPYETSPFSNAAADEIKSFLDENIFCDEELVSLMQDAAVRCGGAIFEDSLENGYPNGIAWNGELAQSFQEEMNYDILKYLPLITGKASSEEAVDSVKNDYNTVISHMYQKYHITPVQEYVNEKTGFAYRAQPYLTRTGFELDLSANAAQVDIAEGESLAFGTNYDSFRLVSGGVHIADKKYVSSESFAIQEGISYNLPWERVVKIMNGDFAAGVNRLIFHGSSPMLSEACDPEASYFNNWPGWSAFSFVCTDDWNARQPHWENIHILSDYIARNQSVLQNGTAKMDLLVYDTDAYDYSTRKRDGDNSALTKLLDAGYTYDAVSTDGLLLDQLTAAEGTLASAEYKAVIVNNIEQTTIGAMKQLLNFAEAGIPIVFYDAVPGRGIGSNDSAEEIQNLLSQIMETGCGYQADSQAEVLRVLIKEDITPNASYIQQNLRNIMREDTDGSRYYYLYNNSEDEIEIDLDLAGEGNLYLLNAWTGDILPYECEQDEDVIHTTLALDGYGTVIAAISPDDSGFQASDASAAAFRGRKAVSETVALDNWKLSIESWGPDAEAPELYATKKTTVDFGETALMSWDNLAVSDEQLAELGVESMEAVSGIGYYTTEIELENAGEAYLRLDHGTDMITEITVNGQPVKELDPTNTRYYLGDMLTTGTNTIQIKLNSTLINRMRIENPMYESLAKGTYGLTEAVIEF